MRRLAVLFAIIALAGLIERCALPPQPARIAHEWVRFRRAFVRLADWRAFLIGPLRRQFPREGASAAL